MSKPVAVLDTSFWSCVVHINLHGFLEEIFQRPIFVPPAVEDEILRKSNAPQERIYPYQKEFEIHKQAGLLTVRAPDEHIQKFGEGEGEALVLAKELNAVLLVNENQSYQHGKSQMGLACVTVPVFVVLLASQNIIASNAAEQRVKKCRHVTSNQYIEKALELLDQLHEVDS